MHRFYSKSYPVYHYYSRCMHRTLFYGLDAATGASYEHRKQWLEDNAHETAAALALDLCGYAIMSNHYHVVLHVNKPQADIWNMDEIINRRWHMPYKGNVKKLNKIFKIMLIDIFCRLKFIFFVTTHTAYGLRKVHLCSDVA